MRRAAACLGMILATAAWWVPARAADPALISPGNIRFAKVANSAFDSYTSNPTQVQRDWMRAHYSRLLAYSPYFDSRLSWFPNAWVYKDLYAIYPGSPLATAHPEWILRDASGNRLYIRFACSGGTCSQYAADIGNPGFRANWIDEAGQKLRAGYLGLYIDDVNMFLSRVSDGNGQPVAPRDPRTGAPMVESDWRRYMAEFTEQIRAAFPGKEIVHNALWFAGTSDPYVQRQLLSADFLGLERGVNDSGIVGGNGTFGFETFLSVIDWVHGHGPAVFFDATAGTDPEREYGLATYFLVSSGQDALGNDPGGTPGDWWTGYDVFLGAAQGGRYAWNGVLRRDFERGVVLVNPPGAPVRNLALGATYLDVAGRQVTSITLASAHGAVLRSAASPPPVSAPPVLLDVVPLPR